MQGFLLVKKLQIPKDRYNKALLIEIQVLVYLTFYLTDYKHLHDISLDMLYFLLEQSQHYQELDYFHRLKSSKNNFSLLNPKAHL